MRYHKALYQYSGVIAGYLEMSGSNTVTISFKSRLPPPSRIPKGAGQAALFFFPSGSRPATGRASAGPESGYAALPQALAAA